MTHRVRRSERGTMVKRSRTKVLAAELRTLRTRYRPFWRRSIAKAVRPDRARSPAWGRFHGRTGHIKQVVPGPGAVLVLLGLAGRATAQDADALRRHATEWERLTAAEDARGATTAQLQVLLNGLRSPHAVLRAVAVRGVGRLERSELAERIAPLLSDSVADVRAAAADALAQSAFRGETSTARAGLHAALATERDAGVVAVLVESLGRLRHRDAESASETVTLLMARLEHDPVTVLGALRGLYLLARQ